MERLVLHIIWLFMNDTHQILIWRKHWIYIFNSAGNFKICESFKIMIKGSEDSVNLTFVFQPVDIFIEIPLKSTLYTE